MSHDIVPVAFLSWNTIAAIGELLWFPIYFIVIYQNYKQKVCGMPLLGITAIFIQCLIYATFGPYWRPDLFPHNPLMPATFKVVWVWRGWLLVQGTVLVQFFLYHDHAKYPLELPVSKAGLFRTVMGLLVVNLFIQWTFIVFYHDYNVNQSDPAAYLILSIGFCMLALYRPNLEGLSYGVAWLKFIATGLIFATIIGRPAESFGTMAVLANSDPIRAQRRACDIPTVEAGQACGLPATHCDVMDVICAKPGVSLERSLLRSSEGNNAVVRTWKGVVAGQLQSDPSGVCEPTNTTVLSAQIALAERGWDVTGPDTVFRSDVGELDLIRKDDPRGAVWCPQTTRWDLVNRVDGEWRFHYQFPVFLCIAGIFTDGVYVYMVWKRRKALRAAAQAVA